MSAIVTTSSPAIIRPITPALVFVLASVCWSQSTTAQIAWTETTVQSSIDGAYALVAADINGDGKIDIVGSALQDTDLYWWSNTAGDGSTWARTTIASSGTWQGLEVADVDGDGDLDVVGADASTENMAWFINNSGDGSSWTQVTIDGSFTDAFEVAVGDLDRDGDLDVVGAAQGADLISWWENNGTPSNPNWTETTVKSSIDALDVAVADIDGDGDLDAIGVDNDPGDAIYWFANNGSGGGWSQTTVDASIDSPRSVQPGDLDGDGDVDLVAAADHADLIVWYENTSGDGTTWTERAIDSAADNARYATMADIDGDGDLDVVGTASSDEEFNWYENTAGDGTSWTQHVVDLSVAADAPVYAITADIDADGDLDVIGSAAASGDFIVWWENSQRGRSSTIGTKTVATSATTNQGEVGLADIDGDGNLDLIGTGTSSDYFFWIENANGSGTSWTEVIIGSYSPNDTGGIVAADIDRDGDLDVVTYTRGGNQVDWWENDGTPGGGSWTDYNIKVFSGPDAIAVGDIDGDGDPDVVGLTDQVTDTVLWWENDGTPTGPDWTPSTIESASGIGNKLTLGDLDGDGDLDVIVAGGTENDLHWYANNGSGGGWSNTTIGSAFGDAARVLAVDVDGDGDLDVLASANSDDEVAWFDNTAGNGSSWTERTIDASHNNAKYLASGDFDSDGDTDVAATGGTAGISYWLNANGAGTSWTETTISFGTFSSNGIAFGDIDGDGDLDIAASAAGSTDEVSWWANDTVILNQGFVISGTAGTANNTGWRILSAPCASQTRATLDNYLSSLQDDEIRRYDESAGSGDARWLNTASGDGLTQGTGFAAYLYDDATQEVGADFGIAFPSCTPTNADVVVSSLDVNEEWFLAGNPYMQSFDLSSFSGTGFQTTYKLWNPSTTSFTNVTASGGSSDVIPVGQGFFVQRTTVGAGGTSVTFDDAGKTSGGTLVAKGGETDYGRIPLRLEVVGASGEQLSNDESASLLIAEDATRTWDHYESGKLTPMVERWATVSLVGERAGRDEALSLLSLPTELGEMVTIPLQIDQSGVAGRATLSWERMEGVPADWDIQLVDTETGFSQDVRRVMNYTFQLAESATKSGYAKGVAMSASGSPRLALVITPASATGTGDLDLPRVYALEQNYPNPFNPETMIRFALPEAGSVTLTVYDVMGREVTTLFDGTKPAGWHEVTFDGRHLATGVYLYRLITPKGELTKTMNLIR